MYDRDIRGALWSEVEAQHGADPDRAGGILEAWTDYRDHRSSFGIPSTLRRGPNDLPDRNLVYRNDTMYSVTDARLAYLQRVGTGKA